MNTIIKAAITLGLKKELRNKYGNEQLLKRVKDIFEEIGYTYILTSVEDYKTTGKHVHVFYVGKSIYWLKFNKLWGLGYVKNKEVYDEPGWIKYVKKHNKWEEHGVYINKPIMERLSGISLIDKIKDIEKDIIEYDDSSDEFNIDIYNIIPDEDDNNLPL